MLLMLNFAVAQIQDGRLHHSDDYVAKPVDFLMTHLIEIPEFEQNRPPGFLSRASVGSLFVRAISHVVIIYRFELQLERASRSSTSNSLFSCVEDPRGNQMLSVRGDVTFAIEAFVFGKYQKYNTNSGIISNESDQMRQSFGQSLL